MDMHQPALHAHGGTKRVNGMHAPCSQKQLPARTAHGVMHLKRESMGAAGSGHAVAASRAQVAVEKIRLDNKQGMHALANVTTEG